MSARKMNHDFAIRTRMVAALALLGLLTFTPVDRIHADEIDLEADESLEEVTAAETPVQAVEAVEPDVVPGPVDVVPEPVKEAQPFRIDR